jgi:lipoate-protein ligase B
MLSPIAYWNALNPGNGPAYAPLSYALVSELQQMLVNKKKNRSTKTDVVLFLEHSPTFTVGKRGWSEYPDNSSSVKRLEAGAEFCKSNRGGLATFHGPGQLIVYPILSLNPWKPDLRWYVKALQRSTIDAIEKLGVNELPTTEDDVESCSPQSLLGVWMGKGQRKLASIGFHAERWIVSHGLALNVTVDLGWFDRIVPCGLKDKQVTSIQKECPYLDSSLLSLSHISTLYISSLSQQFNRPLIPLQEADPSLYCEVNSFISEYHLVK